MPTKLPRPREPLAWLILTVLKLRVMRWRVKLARWRRVNRR
jgi:hypothetical protein